MFSKLIKRCTTIVLPALLAIISAQSFAASDISSIEQNIIAKKFADVRPEFVVSGVEKSDIEGIYIVNFSDHSSVYYVLKGDYFFTGGVLQIKNKSFVDVKERHLRRIALAKLDPNEMIIYPAKGEKKASITVFTDVDCHYCRKLHNEITQINELGIEVKYVAFPRAGVNSPVYNKMVSAWCSTDKQDALNKLKNDQPVFTAACDDNPVAAQYNLGQRLGVTGTPAIVMESGKLLPGYLPADKLALALGI